MDEASKITPPPGYCQCGRGEQTPLAPYNRKELGWLKGQPIRFLAGHNVTHHRLLSREVRVDGVACRTVPLQRGLEAIVDLDDYGRLAQHKWSASRHRKTWYAVRFVSTSGIQTCVYMHSEVLAVAGTGEVDHRNGNGLDNRKLNLRPASRARNACNRDKHSNNTSGFKGVTWDRRRSLWAAQIAPKRKHIHLGYFTSAEEAGRAYDAAAVRYFGNFARLNFPHRKSALNGTIALS